MENGFKQKIFPQLKELLLCHSYILSFLHIGCLFPLFVVPEMDSFSYSFCHNITVITSLVALSFYGASQLKFHWVERYDKLLVGSVLSLVGILTLIFHHHHHEVGSAGGHVHRKLIVL